MCRNLGLLSQSPLEAGTIKPASEDEGWWEIKTLSQSPLEAGTIKHVVLDKAFRPNQGVAIPFRSGDNQTFFCMENQG